MITGFVRCGIQILLAGGLAWAAGCVNAPRFDRAGTQPADWVVVNADILTSDARHSIEHSSCPFPKTAPAWPDSASSPPCSRSISLMT